MSLRTFLVAVSVCVGCLLSGCSGGEDKKPDPKRLEATNPKETPPKVVGKNADPKPSEDPTPKPVEKTPEPKKPRELSKATIEGWEGKGFTAGWSGTTSGDQVVFETDLKNLRDPIPAFKARKATDDASLEGLPSPELPFALILQNAMVTDAGLKGLAGFPNLVYLDLSFTNVKGAGLSALAALPNLASLSLRSTHLTDASLQGLTGLTKLSSLGLGNTGVTDAGLAHLAGLQKLSTLDLGGNDGITDAGLKQLAGLKNLVSLNLFAAKVSAAGRKELQQALPKCVIAK